MYTHNSLSLSTIVGIKPGQVVVMDNATFHKNKRTQELIETAGCRLMIYLPPYSPDLNPIERYKTILEPVKETNSKYYAAV